MTDAPAAVLVVGAGPAGISAALWLNDFGVPFDWVDSSGDIGGMLHRVHNQITNYAAGSFDDGAQLVESFRQPLNDQGLAVREATVERIRPGPDHVAVNFDGRDMMRYEVVLLATGTRYRQLGVPGEQQGLDDGYVSQSATSDGARFAGRDVAVVGGGDAGFENAIRLASHGCRVTMLLRNPDFSARPAFVEQVREHPAIDIAPIPTIVEAVEPTNDGCRLHLQRVDEPATMKVAALFVRIGVDPVLPAGCEDLKTDDEGYVVVDQRGYTSDERVLAAGDVTTTVLPSIAVAVGQGARAARTSAEALNYL